MGLQSTQGYRGKLVDKTTGIILDQFADEDIKVSNNVLELFDLGEIPGTYTQQITLPGTKKNDAFFEQYFDISVWEPDIFNTNQVVEAYLDFDGFYLVNGYLQLNKVNVIENKFVDSYEVTLFGIISNFSIDTRASFLTDLSSLSAYNHTSSLANITSSWAGGLFNGDIVYPMAEYGNDATDQPNFYYSQIDFLGIDDFESGVVVSDFKPAIRVKKVWDAIFSEFGYTYTGSFWQQSWLNNVYMPLNNDKQVPVYSLPIDTYYQAKLTNVSASATTLTAYVSQSFPVNSKEYDYNGAAVLTGGSFTYTTPITTRLDVKLNLAFQVVSGSFGAGSGMPAFYINYMSGSTSVNTQTLARLNGYLSTVAQSRTSVVTEVFNIKDYIVNTPELDPGTYTFQIYYIPQYYNNFQVKLNPDTNNQSSWEIYRVRQAADYKILDVPANMPFGTSGIRVIDFIRSIQKKFNLIIYPDKQNPNQFVVETFNNWYKQGQIQDFNKYINVKDKIEFTPANQLGYRKIRFSDADDTDYVETLFKRTNNRVYGESNFYDSGSYFSQGELEIVADSIASGPLTLVPGSVYSGSSATGGGLGYTCTSYIATNPSGYAIQNITYTECNGITKTYNMPAGNSSWYFCSRNGTAITLDYEDMGNPIIVTEIGDCTPSPTGSSGGIVSGSGYPMWIPYYIADAQYTPARVLPRLYFYNGLRPTTPYWFEGYYSNSSTVSRYQQTQYPYFDNYSTGSLNGTASLYPQVNSKSLLFNNEQAVWGTTPTGSLVSEYWDTYLELLYNPRTRLVNTTAVIPLADYFNLELNDIAEFRGNYYHLRAINDYNLTTGECNIQLLGPVIADVIAEVSNFAPLQAACDFNYTGSLASCAKWNTTELKWDLAGQLWNCS